MTELPAERQSYPYAPMGYDLKTMCQAFSGYGGDIELPNGFRLSAWGQQQLGMNFLKTIQRYFGDWTLNEITAYCFVMNSTIVGELVGVKDVAYELGIPMSTASHVINKLEKNNILQSYPCLEDRRRKWLRMHPKVVRERLESGKDPWVGQRKLLEGILSRDQNLVEKP